MVRETQHLDSTDKELIEEKFKNVYLRIDSNHKELMIYLEKILEQTSKTNGRVAILEKETEYVRIIPRYKKVVGLAFIGLITLLSSLGVIGLLDKFF